MNNITPTISNNNSKLGEFVPGINLPPIITCRKDAPCQKDCYALRGHFRYKNVQKSLDKNLYLYQSNSKYYFEYIILYLKMCPAKYFRWHSSGDIPDMQYFCGMVGVANKCKKTKFLCFTKQYEIINEYLKDHVIPANLTVVFSNWKDFQCVNPNNLPTSWVKFKDNNDYIPAEATKCSGFCGSCVNTKASCWKMKQNESVVFKKH